MITGDVNVRLSVSGAVQLPKASAACGLTEEVKQALLTIAQKVAYIDENGQTYYDALYNALYPPAVLLSISAVFNQGQNVIYDTDTLDSLKQYLTVTGLYDDGTSKTVTNYTLSGTLAEGSSTITVTAGGKTATFTVSVTHKVAQVTGISAVFSQGSAVIYDNASLDDLKPYLVVTASYDDGTSAAVSGYTLSGTLAVGTSTITASYSGFSDTFTVTVTERPVILTSITAVFTQGDHVIYDTDSLDTLKQYLVVTAHYDDNTDAVVSDYALSGTLAEGTSTITVSYGGKTNTFTVVVTQYSREDIFGVFTNGITVVKATGIASTMYTCTRKSAAARACAPIFIENKGYIFTVTDATKYSLVAYDVENDTPVEITGAGFLDSYGYAGGTKTVSWATSDSASTPYVWLALKKNDGTAFTEEELANGAEAVFTYTESGS